MNAPGYWNPDAQVGRAFASALKKTKALRQLQGLRSEISGGPLSPGLVLSDSFKPESRALEVALRDLGEQIEKANQPEEFQSSVLARLTEATGLMLGSVCQFSGRMPFRLARVHLDEPDRYPYEDCRLSLMGPKLRVNGTPYARGTEEFTSFTSLDEIREALGLPPMPAPPHASKAPDAMSAGELAEEIRGHYDRNGWVPDVLRGRGDQVYDILHLLKCVEDNDVSATMAPPGCALAFTLDVNIKENLWIHCARCAPLGAGQSLSSSSLWELKMFKPDGLNIHDFGWLMRTYSSTERVPSISLRTEVQRARLHTVLVYAAEKAINGYTDLLRAKFDVVWAGARVVVRTAEGFLPYLTIAYRASNDDWQPHAAALITGLTNRTLEYAIAPFDWRNPSRIGGDEWAAHVMQAGGDDPRKDSHWLEHVTDFYREHDPETIARRQAEAQAEREEADRARRAEAAAQRKRVEDEVRAILQTAEIGHGTGWRQAVAQAAGISVQKVKPWLQQRLPEEFDRIYPDPARRW